MRYRETTRSHPPFIRKWKLIRRSDGVQTGSGQDGPHTLDSFRERIWDIPDGRGKNNPVWHVTGEVQSRLSHAGYTDGGTNTVFEPGSYPLWDVHQAIDAVPFSNAPIPGSPYLPSLTFLDSGFLNSWLEGANNAFASTPHVMDLGNSLLELSQLKGMVTQILRLFKKWNIWTRYYNRFLDERWNASGPYRTPIEITVNRGRLRRAIRDVDRDVVNGFLGYNFGIRPLVADVKNLCSAIDRITKRLSWLRVHSGETKTLVYSRDYPVNTLAPTGWGTTPGVDTWIRVQGSYRCTYGVRLYQTLQGLDGVGGFLRAFGRYGGFHRPFSIAWNAIPFSFVVDWFYNVGQKIDNLEIPSADDGVYRLDGHWWSCHFKGEVSLIHHPFNGTAVKNLAPNAVNHYVTVKVEKYIRCPGFPPVTTTWSGLSWLQQLLIAALGHQWIRSH